MIETMITPETASSLHPGSVGYGALTCPTCGDRCGFLFADVRCLDCELSFQEKLVGGEDVSTYTCVPCGAEFDVLVAQDENGVWLTASGDRCPCCGYRGADLQNEDPDSFWSADQRRLISSEGRLQPALIPFHGENHHDQR